MTLRTMPTGECSCGCDDLPKGLSYFAQGHDRSAEVMLTKMTHGSVLARLMAHGYGPGGKNLYDEYQAWKARQGSKGRQP